MKLLTKLNIRYIIYSLTVTMISGVLIYFLISMIVTKQLDEKLTEISDRVEQKLAENGKVEWLKPYVYVNEIEKSPESTLFNDTIILNSKESELEEYRQLIKVKHIHQSFYRIIVRESKLESEDLIQTLAGITLLAILFLTISLILINRKVARSIWEPFYENLKRIEGFKLADHQPLSLQQTGITEFDSLNEVIIRLTNQIISDFENLKQFSEDASHELQTPLAIVSTKLETLLNDPEIGEKQLITIQSVNFALQRLSKLSKALLLLTKIENNQFLLVEKIKLSPIIYQKLDEFLELLKLKEITVEYQFSEDFEIKSNPVLADFLLNNLLSNAINHNVPGGTIRIILNPDSLEIQNTGRTELAHPEKLFLRFYKESHSTNSLGLGLAIVAKICEIQGWKVSYSYNNSLHSILVLFRI
ncbi:MAG: HAMP domain-containing sensor histidine kinase [Prolixibacteraceae bacterium]